MCVKNIKRGLIILVLEIKKILDFCPECGGSILNILERGDIICQFCGLVIFEKEIDISNSGIRAYNKQDKLKKERTGSPMSILMPDISLSTTLDRNRIYTPDLRRAAKWNTHLTWEKRNMLIAITELKRIATNLNIPDHVKKSTVKLYKEVYKKKILHGRSIIGMIAACTYYKCKEEKIPLTFQDILNESSIGPNIIKKSYKLLIRKLNLKSPNISPISLIPKFISNLGLEIEVEKQVIGMLKNYLEKNPSSGKDPRGICAGALYLITKLKNIKISQKDISQVVGVTEVTLRSRYKEILNSMSFNF